MRMNEACVLLTNSSHAKNCMYLMGCDKDICKIVNSFGGTVVTYTYTYSGDGLKRSEITGSGRTTMIWDGSEVLQERN